MHKYILFIAACASLFSSCVSEPVFDIVPFIKFETVTKSSLIQANPTPRDSTLITISFQDGDGDLGGDSIAIFVVDTRTGNVETQFRLVSIEQPGTSGAISGTISFPVFGSCCIYVTGQAPCTPSNPLIEQELIYEIFIKDRAGNESNRVQVTPINLICS